MEATMRMPEMLGTPQKAQAKQKAKSQNEEWDPVAAARAIVHRGLEVSAT
jgi:hypothetical protein